MEMIYLMTMSCCFSFGFLLEEEKICEMFFALFITAQNGPIRKPSLDNIDRH